MSKNHSALGACLIALMLAGCSAANAQGTFPAKPIRIVTAAAGGGGDFSARIIAQGLTHNVGQQVIVDNRGGGSGIIAAQTVQKSPADGYTLLLYSSSFWLLPFLQDNVPYDPLKDFAPITMTDMAPNVLVVHPSLPAKSIRELIALAKARPGQLNYARQSPGSPNHLAAELFKIMGGVKITPIPYKGGGPVVLATVAGEVEVAFVTLGGALGSIKSKRLRALAVTSAERSRLFPDLPTIAATLPGFESLLVNGLFAPAGTPASVISTLNQEIARVLRAPEVKERYLNTGVETVGMPADKFEAYLKSDMAKWGKLIKAVNIRIE